MKLKFKLKTQRVTSYAYEWRVWRNGKHSKRGWCPTQKEALNAAKTWIAFVKTKVRMDQQEREFYEQERKRIEVTGNQPAGANNAGLHPGHSSSHPDSLQRGKDQQMQ